LAQRALLAALVFLSVSCVAVTDEQGAEPQTSSAEKTAAAASTLSLADAAALVLPTLAPDDCRLPRPDMTPPPQETPDAAVRLVPPRGVQLPPEYDPISFVEDEALREQILDILGDEADSYAVFVKDLKTGRGVSINAEEVFYAASVFKLFVMYELFNQQSQGLVRWADQLVVTPYYDSFGLNVRGTALCETVTVARALVAMMAASDNAAAVLLQDLVGAGNVNESLKALGLAASEITEALPLTAADVALLLEAIGRGQAVSASASAEMIGLMKREELDNGLGADLPEGVELAHKTGNWFNATHDAGIVFAPGGAYVIVVLSDKDHETALIRRLARAVFEHFEPSAATPGP